MTDQEAENARLLDRLTKQQEINQSLRADNAQLKEDFAGWKASYDDDIREARAEGIDELKAAVEKLKAELLDINAKHHRDTQKTCLEAKFNTWREEQVKYNSGYSLEEEARWLVYEAINIQDAIEVFNELYDDGIGDEYTWRLECDHERNWNIIQLYMDEEGEYTLTEEEFEAQNK